MKKTNLASIPRLLILSCSQRKRPAPGLLPALERYDGPLFRVVNKFMRGNPPTIQVPHVYILSAKFGLIPARKPIAYYDHRATSQRIKELQAPVLRELKQISLGRKYCELFISMGKDYLQAFRGYESLIPPNLKVTISEGGMGHRQAELRHWLYGEPLMLSNEQTKTCKRRKARLRGIEIALTPKQIMDIARLGLAVDRQLPPSQVWYVPVDKQQVPVKWLVSQLTGLPVHAFHTSEARRVLHQLAIEVCSQ